MKNLSLLLFGFLLFVGCSESPESKFAEFTPMQLSVTISEYEKYIEMWKGDLATDWKSKIESGEAVVPEAEFDGELSEYPEWKIGKFEEAIVKLKDELASRN